MKKITLLLSFFVAALAFQAQAQETEEILSQTQGGPSNNGVACGDSGAGTTGDNAYFRAYTPEDYGKTDEVYLTGVEFYGATLEAPMEVQVQLFDWPDFPDLFDVAETPDPILTQTVELDPSMQGQLIHVTFDEPVAVDASHKITVGIFEGDDHAGRLYIGTADSEDAPGYLASIACEINNPTLPADIGFADSIFIIDLAVSDEMGVEEVLTSKISVYPNPAVDVVNVQLPAGMEVLSSTIVDVTGKSMNAQFVNGQINVSDLASGIYFLKLETNQGAYTQKVVKK